MFLLIGQGFIYIPFKLNHGLSFPRIICTLVHTVKLNVTVSHPLSQQPGRIRIRLPVHHRCSMVWISQIFWFMKDFITAGS